MGIGVLWFADRNEKRTERIYRFPQEPTLWRIHYVSILHICSPLRQQRKCRCTYTKSKKHFATAWRCRNIVYNRQTIWRYRIISFTKRKNCFIRRTTIRIVLMWRTYGTHNDGDVTFLPIFSPYGTIFINQTEWLFAYSNEMLFINIQLNDGF